MMIRKMYRKLRNLVYYFRFQFLFHQAELWPTFPRENLSGLLLPHGCCSRCPTNCMGAEIEKLQSTTEKLKEETNEHECTKDPLKHAWQIRLKVRANLLLARTAEISRLFRHLRHPSALCLQQHRHSLTRCHQCNHVVYL